MGDPETPCTAASAQDTALCGTDRTIQQGTAVDTPHPETTFEECTRLQESQPQEIPVETLLKGTSCQETHFEGAAPLEKIQPHLGGISIAEDTHLEGTPQPTEQDLHSQHTYEVQGRLTQEILRPEETCHGQEGVPAVQGTPFQEIAAYHELDGYQYAEPSDGYLTASTDMVYLQESFEQTPQPTENYPQQIDDFQEKEDAKNRKAQEYYEFKESIGRLTTSCGNSYAGDLVATCSKEFSETGDNYLRGCKWSPDGSMLIVNSNDNVMRTFHLPDAVITNQWNVETELKSRMNLKETDTVFDFCWHPGTTLESPDTCLFATTCRETPIHLFNALTGNLVCSYRPYNHVDEIVAAHSIGFTSDGKYLVSGFNRTLRCFATDRPGRDCVTSSTIMKERSRKGRVLAVHGQRSILSCFAAHPTSPCVVAAGAFNGDVAIYDVPSGQMTTMFEGQSGGITHVLFSKDGNYLFAGGRKNPEINCFDIRNPEKVLYVLYRYVATNQRIYFDLDGSSRYLLSGNHNGVVSVWDLQGEAQLYDSLYTPWPQLNPIINFQAHCDAVNGCSVNPHHTLLATCSGQRHFAIDLLDEVADVDLTNTAIPPQLEVEENTLKVWNLKLPG